MVWQAGFVGPDGLRMLTVVNMSVYQDYPRSRPCCNGCNIRLMPDQSSAPNLGATFENDLQEVVN